MKKIYQKYRFLFISILAVCLIAASVYAISSYDIHRHFIGAGGQSGGGGYTLTGSIGQHDAGMTMTGGEYKLSGGFWGTGAGVSASIYLPLVIR